MELKELTEKTLKIFNVETPDQLNSAIMQTVMRNDESKYHQFCDCVKDLSVDWLQSIFQYYSADRKGKKQDYTPRTLARFVAKLSAESNDVIDMCAGSGALTIQRWNINHEATFSLYEFDENVIPYLLFNMALRNIQASVFHSDVLTGETFHEYAIAKGEYFGITTEVKK